MFFFSVCVSVGACVRVLVSLCVCVIVFVFVCDFVLTILVNHTFPNDSVY